MSELAELAAQQQRDAERNNYQDPQRLGGLRTVSFTKFIDAERDFDGDGVIVPGSVPTGAAKVGGVAGPKPSWVVNRVHPVWRPRTGRDVAALASAVKPFLDDLTIPQLEAIKLVVFGQRSQRNAAEILGITQPPLFRRLQRAYESLRVAIERRFDLAGSDFAPERLLNESDKCRAPLCEGHFTPSACIAPGCVTILPRHYNPRTTCWTHSRGATSHYQFIQAALLSAGLQAWDGHTRRADARSAAVSSSAAVA